MSAVAPISLPDEFNAASYFVDHHITEGRDNKVAIECGEVQVTYRQFFERVNQAGNTLLPKKRTGNLLVKADSTCANCWIQHKKTKDSRVIGSEPGTSTTRMRQQSPA